MNIFTVIFVILSITLLVLMVKEDNKRNTEASNCYKNGGVLVRTLGESPYICIDRKVVLK